MIVHMKTHTTVWAARVGLHDNGPYTYKLAIANIAKNQANAPRVKGPVIALAIAQKCMHNLLL